MAPAEEHHGSQRRQPSGEFRERRLPAVWFYGAGAICAFLLGTTVLKEFAPETGPAAAVLRRFDLAAENNAAVWWAGMLLALVSLQAFDGYARLRRCEPGAAKGWALLAAVLLILSADEVASIHDRVGLYGETFGIGTWLPLLPFGIVLAAMLGSALALLWRSEEQQGKVRLIVIGLLLLASSAMHEYTEHKFEWPTPWARAARVALEEGSELLGTLILLKVTMGNTAGLCGRGGAGVWPTFEALRELRRPLVVLGLALVPVLAAVTAMLPDPQRGHPADWLAAVAFLAAGLVVYRRLFQGDAAISWPAWLLGGLCCLASVATVAVPPYRLIGFGPVGIQVRMLVISVIGLVISAVWASVPGGGRRVYRLGAVVLGPLAALSPLVTRNLVLIYALSQFLGLIVYTINSTAEE